MQQYCFSLDDNDDEPNFVTMLLVLVLRVFGLFALLCTAVVLAKPEVAAEVLDADGELVMKVGVKVQRGPDWQYGRQDGGEKSIGIVIEISSWRTPERAKANELEGKHDRVRVLWKDIGTSNVYRYGFGGKYDVVVVDKSTKVGC